jgi:hypothetical protein
MLRETMIENEWRRNRMLILAQQLANAEAEQKAVAKPAEPEAPAS